MKKIVLLIVTIIALALAAYSQGSVYAKYSKYASRDYKGELKFDDEYRECGITFTLKDNYITADDKARSVYKIIRKEEIVDDGRKESQDYICTDEKDRDCIISIVMYKNGDKYLLLGYEEFAYIYRIN